MRFRPALAVTALVVIGVEPTVAQSPGRDVTVAIEQYRGGAFDAAVAQFASDADLGPFRLRFIQELPAWIASDPGVADQRRAAAAAFLLELTHVRIEADYGRFADLIEWMCVQLRSAATPSTFERVWHQASVALVSRARSRTWLLGEYPRLPTQPPVKAPPTKKNEPVSPRHLLHALERFPDDGHLQLARVVAWLWGRDAEPTRNTETSGNPERIGRRRPPQLEAITALTPLVADPAVGPEARFRIGLVHFSTGDYAAALDAFDSAHARAADEHTKYLGLFNAGRALEALGRHSQAMAQYRAALAVIPGAESARIALASLHFMRDERTEALALLEQVFAEHEPDPGRLAGYGSFIRWSELKARLRAEVAR